MCVNVCVAILKRLVYIVKVTANFCRNFYHVFCAFLLCLNFATEYNMFMDGMLVMLLGEEHTVV